MTKIRNIQQIFLSFFDYLYFGWEVLGTSLFLSIFAVVKLGIDTEAYDGE